MVLAAQPSTYVTICYVVVMYVCMPLAILKPSWYMYVIEQPAALCAQYMIIYFIAGELCVVIHAVSFHTHAKQLNMVASKSAILNG